MSHKIRGTVVKGDGYGRKLGFPTANLATEFLNEAKEGVYAGRAELEGKIYRAGVVIDPNSKVEAHLLGYEGDAYGKVIELELEKFLRPYKKFNTEEELIIQIKKDISQC